MHFNLKKYNTSGLIYVDDGQIAITKIKEKKIINTNSIVFVKPYKIQVRASKMIEGKRTIKKKTMKFDIDTTLLEAIKEATKVYEAFMNDIENATIVGVEELVPSMLFKDVYKLYTDEKVKEHENSSVLQPYREKEAKQFFNKWLEPIHNMRMNDIFRTHITTLKSKMKAKDGTPLSDRSKLAVHQVVNPIYKYFNLNSNYDLKSPAIITKIDRIADNTRKFKLKDTDITSLFRKLRDYPITPVREIFMWLMHGRRRNEVLTLEWTDIDFEENTYTIRALNNKARKDMTYKLSKRLRVTLDVIGIQESGYVFKRPTNTEHFSPVTLYDHWSRVISDDNKYDLVMHQLRSCIVSYLKDKHLISTELSGYIVGHTQEVTVTDRYGTYGHDTLNDTLNLMLDKVFDDEFSEKKVVDDKLKQLQLLFPEKSVEQLKAFLNV